MLELICPTMKTKLVSLTWRGTASVDPRFSASMLSWSVSDICTRDTHDKVTHPAYTHPRFPQAIDPYLYSLFPSQLSVGIENGQLEAYNCDFEQQFGHHIKHVVGVCRVLARRAYTGKAKPADFAFVAPKPAAADADPFMSIVGPQHGFVYLLKDPRDPLLHIHLFEGDSAEEVSAFCDRDAQITYAHQAHIVYNSRALSFSINNCADDMMCTAHRLTPLAHDNHNTHVAAERVALGDHALERHSAQFASSGPRWFQSPASRRQSQTHNPIVVTRVRARANTHSAHVDSRNTSCDTIHYRYTTTEFVVTRVRVSRI